MPQSIRPSISIALCTYNGTAYLPAQWQSLLEQDLLPDEVVISDDQSTDGTVELIAELAAKAPFTVRILDNPARLGSNRNFERALSACTGDLIYLCDQDDFWLPEKIATVTQYMVENPAIQVAFCDAWVTDEHLKSKQGRMWEVVRFNSVAQARWQSGEAMEVLLDGNRMMGCASVIRKSFLSYVLPIPTDLPGDYIYDGWIALVAAANNQIAYINKPLQLYRTHVQQQVGVRPQEAPETVLVRKRVTRQRTQKLAPLQLKQAQLTRINQLLVSRLPDNAPGFSQLYRRLAHFTMRGNLPDNRLKRLVPVLGSIRLGNYRRYADASANWYAPYLAILGDILE